MTRRHAFLGFLAFALAVTGFAQTTGPRSGKWAHEGSKLTPDPQVVWGKLDNGFRYALRPHKGVPGRVSLQLIVLSGSMDERPDELGIAHYTEHMAFGGSKHFKSEEMIDLFQRLGIEYGSDVNAFTTFDFTAFRLDYRSNEQALLKEGLLLFRDFGDGVAFPQDIIERERKVVQAELRLRDTLSGQKDLATMPVVFRGLKFPERSPGGKEELIQHFTRDQFLKFYQRCYRSDLMILVAAGDFEPAAMEALVKEQFAGMVKPAEPIPVRDEGRLDAKALRAGIFRIAGVGSAETEVASVTPVLPGPDTREAHIERQKREFVMDVFADRLKSQIPNASGGDAHYEIMLGNMAASASTQVAADDWKHGIVALDELVRNTSERGLDTADFETHRERELRLINHQIDQLPTLDPSTFCDALLDAITSHSVFLGLDRSSEMRREWLEKITPGEGQQVFKSMWALNTMAFDVAGGVSMELEPSKILEAVQKYRKAGLTYLLPKAKPNVTFKLYNWGTPTAVVERSELPALNAKLMRFGNNVRLNFISNRLEPGIAHVIVRVGSGLLDMTANKPALKEFGLNTLLASGAEHYQSEQLQGLIEERFLEFGFDVDDRDAFTFHGTVATKELDTFLGLVTDFLHDPSFNSYAHQEEKLNAAMGRAQSSIGMQDGMRELNDHLFKGDARFMSGTPIDYISLSVNDVKRWMLAPLAKGYIEVTIVGDVSPAAVEQSMSRTLGSLATRATTKVPAAPEKPLKVVAAPGYDRIEFSGEQNTGKVVGTWPVGGALRVRDQTALDVLAKVLEIRIRTEIREKLGLAYAPQAQFISFDGFPGFALLQSYIDCAPNDAEKVGKSMQAIGALVAEKGVTEGEFIGSRGILKSQLQRSFLDNSFLASILMRAQERPQETADIVRLRSNLVDEVTLAEVNKWAAEVLPAKNCRAAAVVPKATIGEINSGAIP